MRKKAVKLDSQFFLFFFFFTVKFLKMAEKIEDSRRGGGGGNYGFSKKVFRFNFKHFDFDNYDSRSDT